MHSLCHAIMSILLCLLSEGSGGDASSILSQTPIQTEENRSVFLSCYSTSDPINDRMSWILNDKTNYVNLTVNPCRAVTYPLNRTDRYTLNCSDIHNISLTIRSIDRQQHGDTWQCRIGFFPSNVVTMYVKVPVETIEIRFTDKGFIPENTTSSFTCKSSFSRPKTEIYWFLSKGTPDLTTDEHLNSNIKETLVNITVGNRTNNVLTSTESELALKVQRSMNKQKIYCSTNDTSGKVLKSTFETLNISYPPSLPEFSIQSKNGKWLTVSSEINVKENNSLTINCNVQSNPVSTFSWTGPKSSNNETLKLKVTNNRTEGSYTCSAKNVMTQTNGTSLEGMKNNSICVNVLYPPSDISFTVRYQSTAIYVNTNVNMLENISYILTCSSRGKPEPKYSWTGTFNASSDVLNFTSINRSMAGHYTCTAKNTMNESTGNIYNGQDNKTIYLNIQYASEVTEFFVAGHKENNLVITNQKENATFHCNVDSNPSPAIDLQFKDKRLHFVNHTDTKNLSYFIRNLTCSDAGIYYCYSSNRINYGKRSRKQLTFIVKCPPLPEKDLNFNVSTLKYVSATFSFIAMDYLDSNITTFTWQRENNASQWETVKHDTKGVKVSTFNMQTNLTVVNVTEYYSGKYRVIYNNSVGGNTQMFQLFVADLPDTPTYFEYLKDSLTSTQVTVVWTKGYGGGLRQTFVLNISQRSQPIKCDYINETENEDMQHTITGLSSGTQYNLTLWATNVLGKSSSQTLTIFTKESETKEASSLPAAIVGSVSSLVAIIAGVSVVFMLYKRRCQTKTDRSNRERSFDDSSEMNAQFGRKNPFKREPVYEGLKAINERGDVEIKEQTYDILKHKQDSSETKDPVYTNLKL